MIWALRALRFVGCCCVVGAVMILGSDLTWFETVSAATLLAVAITLLSGDND